MKKVFIQILALLIVTSTNAQVTQLSSNSNFTIKFPLGNNKAILGSPNYTLWVTDGSPEGTFQLSNTVQYHYGGGVLNNYFIFPGYTAATGTELWITDGTTAGTKLLKDIYNGTESSYPDDNFVLFNGYLYFTAAAENQGRELWRTDGTEAGTTLVKDIVPGSAGIGIRGQYSIFTNGSYLLFNASTPDAGYEVWKSDGTTNGTVLLKDINAGTASSDANNFYAFNNIVLFTANDGVHGQELWKTDGTTAGTELVKDINNNPTSSFNFISYYRFNNSVYFLADDGVHGEEIWATDGTTNNTTLLKDINPGTERSFINIWQIVKVGNKMLFPAYNPAYGSEIWESDGTANGTKLFKEVIPGIESGVLYFFAPFNTSNPVNQPLYNGKFLFLAGMPDSGTDLWVSDGTTTGTTKFKTINPVSNYNNVVPAFSYFYTTSGLYFVADDGLHGLELWKSDATEAGTQLVADVNPGSDSSKILFAPFTVNNKVLFLANNGASSDARYLFRIDASHSPLPVILSDFTVSLNASDAVLQWSTLQEINSRDFVIERSFDGFKFTAIGTVTASGSSSIKKSYSFVDAQAGNATNNVIYYRLQLNDKDGKSTTSKIISIRLNGAKDWTVKLNQNPVQNNLSVMVNGNTNTTLSVVDISGKTIQNKRTINSNGLINIPLNSVSPGIYVLVAENENLRKVIRFVKQ